MVPEPAACSAWNPPHIPAGESNLRRVRSPNPMMVRVHPKTFAGLYLFIFLMAMPQKSEKLEDTIAVGRIFTLDSIGSESRQAWKYTGK